MRVAVLPLGRPTFDVAYAEERLAAMLATLDATEHEVVGARTLLMDPDATRAAVDALDDPDLVLILQVTFTDAALTAEIAERPGPLAIWALPEPRTGGRLRLNAFCGLNLASHALGLRARAFSWLYAAPDDAEGVADLLDGKRAVAKLTAREAEPTEAGQAIADRLKGRRIARIGERPAGFDTCAYDPERLAGFGVEVQEMPLDELFDAARAQPSSARLGVRAELTDVAGLGEVDQAQLDRSLALKAALDDQTADAFALRCWPETFTDYGGAICGAVSMLGDQKRPCACEADVMGALPQLLLQEVADAPVFAVDLVDLDERSDTAVVWHCGQAPRSMADGPVSATIHSNRKMPLLMEFALKPGRVTLARLSQGHGEPKLVVAEAEALKRPLPFSGTSGTIRFDAHAGTVLKRVIDSGLEHHTALAYGSHGEALIAAGAAMGLPVLEL